MEILITVLVVGAIALPFVAVVVIVVIWNRVTRRRAAEPVNGTVTVTSVSNPTQGELLPTLGDFVPAHEDVTIEGTANVPGMAPYPVRFRDAGWTNRWPTVGQTVPVVVDKRDPSNVRIRWDELG